MAARRARSIVAGMQIALSVLPYLIVLCLVAVVATLFTGLAGMARAGEFNRRHGNRLMRLRVGLQGLAIALFIIYMVLLKTAA